VIKDERGNAAVSHVEDLEGTERVDEIARMLGGIKITRASREHASELLHEAQRPRKEGSV
jgi:DNA repair protein RecN (Recombination protein N)